MTYVKICGLREPEHALAAAEAGADFLGMVFAESRRQITVEQAQAIVRAVRGSGATGDARPYVVGIFANQQPETVNRIAEECELNFVQLSGEEPWEFRFQVLRTVIKAVRVREGQSLREVLPDLRRGYSLLLPSSSFILVEPHVPGSYGGAGQAMDWGLARELARRVPFLLAGGLTPENVGQAIAQVRPWGVDVSSGVETDGVKDVAKVHAFIAAARQADRAMQTQEDQKRLYPNKSSG